MTKTRSQRLSEILDKIDEQISSLEDLKSEVEDHYGNMEGTNLEQTERYSILTEAAETLDSGISDLQNAVETLRDTTFNP